MSLVNMDFLDREAQLYKKAKQELEQSSLNIQTTIKNNTKEESDAVQRAIDILNKKVEYILNEDTVKDEQKKIEKSQEQMDISINTGVKTFFKIRDIIRSKNLGDKQTQTMEKKAYDKIISKFLTQNEIDMFERMISMGPIMVMPGGTIGRNNMLLN